MPLTHIYNGNVSYVNDNYDLSCKSRDSGNSYQMTKEFRIWQKNGEPLNIFANRIEFTKEKDGLSVKLFNGRAIEKHTGVVALTEILPPIVIERKKK